MSAAPTLTYDDILANLDEDELRELRSRITQGLPKLPPGRPRILPEEQERVSAQVSSEQMKRVRAAALADGISVAEFTRRAIDAALTAL